MYADIKVQYIHCYDFSMKNLNTFCILPFRIYYTFKYTINYSVLIMVYHNNYRK